jgi:ABC-type microcin C transport system duplicated ATPase subunit YejF
MIAQEVGSSLNPVLPAGRHIEQILRHHEQVPASIARERALDLLARVGISDALRVHDAFAHELSAGTRQRVLIAMALACRPDLLIADEPTASLDATLGIEILDLLAELRNEMGMTVLWITHQIPLAAARADRIAVMHAGAIVETAPPPGLLTEPVHPHTVELLNALPRGPRPAAPDEEGRPSDTLIDLRGLCVDFPIQRGVLRRTIDILHAVDRVDLRIRRGKTVALIGGSGCGKTTLGRAILQLVRVRAGSVLYDGRDLTSLRGAALRPYRRRLQLVAQDPLSSLDPRMPVGEQIDEVLCTHEIGATRAARNERIAELLTQVGLRSGCAHLYPHEFSGGQRQRIAIARSLAPGPEFLVLDEVTSALDLCSQARIVKLLRTLQEDLGLTYLFITHDLTLAGDIADEIAVMCRGRVVEHGTAREILDAPQHPYTRSLLAAHRIPGDPELRA